MAYTFIRSNFSESFFSDHRLNSLFYPSSVFSDDVIIIGQNARMGFYVKKQLAGKIGICLDFKPELPENGLRSLAAGYPMARELLGFDDESSSFLHKPLFINDSALIIYKKLEEILFDDAFALKSKIHDDYRELAEYLAVFPINYRGEKLFNLARVASGLLISSYGMRAPEILNQSDDGNLSGAERWQTRLIKDYFGSDSPYTLLPDLLRKITASNDVYVGSKRRVILIGSSFLGETAMNFFVKLSRDIDVYHFCFTPALNMERFSPDTFPLSFAKNVVEMEAFTDRLTDSRGYTRIDLFNAPQSTSLLSRVKSSFVSAEVLAPAAKADRVLDDSIKIISCTDERRQIETLKDEILWELSRDSDLKCHDIGVMAPDINRYSAYIDAIFTKERDDNSTEDKIALPFNIIDMVVAGESAFARAYARAFLDLLELPGSRFTRESLLQLIFNPCFADKWDINDNDKTLWPLFCEQYSVLWGYDAAHRSALNLGSSSWGSWRSAIGALMNNIVLGEAGEFPSSIKEESLSKLAYIVQSLFDDFYGLIDRRHTLIEWSDYFEKKTEEYLSSPEEPWDREWVKRVFRNAQEVWESIDGFTAFTDKTLPYAPVKEIFARPFSEANRKKGRFLLDGVTFSSIKPLRAIPFKIIFLLGMNEKEFPEDDVSVESSFDIAALHAESYRGAFSDNARDASRYAFLESVVSAQKKVRFLYKRLDAVTGEELFVSSCVSDLTKYVEDTFNLPIPLVDHPIYPFSREYFKPGSGMATYDAIQRRHAEIYYRQVGDSSRKESLLSRERRSVRTEAVTEVELNDLITFLEGPCAYFIKKIARVEPSGGQDRAMASLIRSTESYHMTNSERKAILLSYCKFVMEGGVASRSAAAGYFKPYKDGKALVNFPRESYASYELDAFYVEALSFADDFHAAYQQLFKEESRLFPIEYTLTGERTLRVGERGIRIRGTLSSLSGSTDTGDLLFVQPFLNKILLESGGKAKPEYESLKLDARGYVYALILGAGGEPNLNFTRMRPRMGGRRPEERSFITGLASKEASLQRLDRIVTAYLAGGEAPIPLICSLLYNKVLPDGTGGDYARVWREECDVDTRNADRDVAAFGRREFLGSEIEPDEACDILIEEFYRPLYLAIRV